MKIAIGFILFGNLFCSIMPLKVSSIQLCDLWDNQGICQEPWNGTERTYQIPSSESGKMKSHRDLFHYIYFTTRETPGVLLKWNRDLTEDELRRETKEDCRFRYTYKNHIHTLSGFDNGKNYMGGFQYLTNILEDDFKSRGIWESTINPKELQRIPIQFMRSCGSLNYKETVWITIALKE